MKYSEHWYIQNQQQKYIQNFVKQVRWSVLRKYLTAIVIFANYNNFHIISFSRSLFYKINTGLMFTAEVLILCKKHEPEGHGSREF